MPKKKSVPADEQPIEVLASEKSGPLPEDTVSMDSSPSDDGIGVDAPSMEEIPSVDVSGNNPALESPPEDIPAGDILSAGSDNLLSAPDSAAEVQPLPGGVEMDSDDPEYGALLQELGEADCGDARSDEPITLDPMPDTAFHNEAGPLVLADAENDIGSDAPVYPEQVDHRPRRGATEAAVSDPRQDRVLTIKARDEVQTAEEQEAIIWHEIQNAHWTKRILTGTLDGVERTESGMTVAVVCYKGFRIAIPVKEMMLSTGRVPSGADFEKWMARMRGILTARLGSEIDFIIKGHENKTRSVVASRRDAMLRKRLTFYLDKNELGGTYDL